LKEQAVYYFAAVMGMPNNLIQLASPSMEEDREGVSSNSFAGDPQITNPEFHLGSVRARLGFTPVICYNTRFSPYVPPTGATPADVLCYSPATRTNFVFLNTPVPAWQAAFARQFSQLVQSNGCHVIALHMPDVSEGGATGIPESRYWPDFFQMDMPLMGIPCERLFAGLSDEQVKRLFCDLRHLNENGQVYFTPLITPTLLDLHENRPSH